MNKYIEYEIQGTGIPFVFLHAAGFTTELLV